MNFLHILSHCPLLVWPVLADKENKNSLDVEGKFENPLLDLTIDDNFSNVIYESIPSSKNSIYAALPVDLLFTRQYGHWEYHNEPILDPALKKFVV